MLSTGNFIDQGWTVMIMSVVITRSRLVIGSCDYSLLVGIRKNLGPGLPTPCNCISKQTQNHENSTQFNQITRPQAMARSTYYACVKRVRIHGIWPPPPPPWPQTFKVDWWKKTNINNCFYLFQRPVKSTLMQSCSLTQTICRLTSSQYLTGRSYLLEMCLSN